MKDWEKPFNFGYWFGVLVGVLASLALYLLLPNNACAQTSWENNPLNYKNSPYNFDNSQYNYKNSQYNWENSPYNLDSKSSLYSNDGSRIGYEVQNSQGTRNIYDNNGNRVGYGR
jgi:4-amino-4-deoxy-L-arabinose transferase-like glycosyltransferase